MDSALIVSASKAGAEKIREWLGEGCACESAESVAEARAALTARRYGLLIVNAPLADGSGEALCAGEGVNALLIVPEARYEAACERMLPRGVLVLPRPISPKLFAQAIALLRASRARLEHLAAKLDEVRAVERAKWALIQTLQMTEAQAHRYIEKQAMDLRQTKRAVAENIIRTYEN